MAATPAPAAFHFHDHASESAAGFPVSGVTIFFGPPVAVPSAAAVLRRRGAGRPAGREAARAKVGPLGRAAALVAATGCAAALIMDLPVVNMVRCGGGDDLE